MKRIREEIEMQMADESLKQREVKLQMKALNNSHAAHVNVKYGDTAAKLAEQHRKFMVELNQVKVIELYSSQLITFYPIMLCADDDNINH
jgi:hypothetical protein